jgi:hypothetical protein
MINVEAALRQTAALIVIRLILEEPGDDKLERIEAMVAAVFADGRVSQHA